MVSWYYALLQHMEQRDNDHGGTTGEFTTWKQPPPIPEELIEVQNRNNQRHRQDAPHRILHQSKLAARVGCYCRREAGVIQPFLPTRLGAPPSHGAQHRQQHERDRRRIGLPFHPNAAGPQRPAPAFQLEDNISPVLPGFVPSTRPAEVSRLRWNRCWWSRDLRWQSYL